MGAEVLSLLTKIEIFFSNSKCFIFMVCLTSWWKDCSQFRFCITKVNQFIHVLQTYTCPEEGQKFLKFSRRHLKKLKYQSEIEISQLSITEIVKYLGLTKCLIWVIFYHLKVENFFYRINSELSDNFRCLLKKSYSCYENKIGKIRNGKRTRKFFSTMRTNIFCTQ